MPAYKTVPVSHDQLKALCRLKPTLKDVAAFFDCSEDTIERRCREYESLSFADFRTKYMAHTRFDLIRKALRMAETSPAIMIFCLKNICKWVDKHEAEITEKSERLIINLSKKEKQESK